MNEIAEQKLCCVCGEAPAVALGRCGKCYQRYRRSGTDISHREYTDSKYLGQIRSGWIVTEVLRENGRINLLLKCLNCGATRKVSARRLDAVGEHRDCVVLKAKTDKQRIVAKALAENHNNITKTAAQLGKSKATISSMYQYMRKNYEGRGD